MFDRDRLLAEYSLAADAHERARISRASLSYRLISAAPGALAAADAELARSTSALADAILAVATA